MQQENALIIFAKNAVAGKVKSRLARTIGPEKALEVYRQLLWLTYESTHDLGCDKYVFYTPCIEEDDIWDPSYRKYTQQGDGLGERMKHAFDTIFKLHYKKAVIIGTDCPLISTGIISRAFGVLQDNDLAIGPAEDGGYYLLGMRSFQPGIFDDISWSTAGVLQATLHNAGAAGLSHSLLPCLPDIDEEKDLVHLPATKPRDTLVMVYNADGDWFSGLADMAHKIISPQTYACRLCALTYGNFTVKKQWSRYLESLPLEISFLHRDQFAARYGEAALPAIFLQKNKELKLLVSKAQIDACASLEELTGLISRQLTTA